MKLPFNFSFKKKEIKNYFLALLLQDETVTAVIFEEQNNKLHVIGHSQASFATTLEDAPFEEFLDIVDKAISTAEQVLPDNIQTQKTVFGVKSEWITEGKIKKDYLTKLKKMCDQLTLTPIGFLVFSEAILHLLQKEEGAPVSAIFVETGKKYITISIIRAGRIVETRQVAFESHIPQVVDETLKTFNDVEILPARVILFDSENNDKLAQSFITHAWSKTLPFLHMPQVTILPANFDTKAILYGTATQMGFDVLQNQTGMPVKTHIGAPTIVKPQEVISAKNETSHKTQQPEIEEEDLKEISLENTPMQETNDVPEEDAMEEESSLEETTKENVPETVSSEYFGFMKNQDVAKAAPKITKPTADNFEIASPSLEERTEELPEMFKEKETEQGELPRESMMIVEGMQQTVKQMHLKQLLHHVQQSITHLMKKSPHVTKPQGSAPAMNNKLLLLVPVVLVICIIAIVLYITGMKATVTVFVTPKTIEEKQNITFVTSGSSDFAQNTLAIDTPSIDESDNATANATGSKDVGTPAKGQVTIFSTLTDSTTLPKGTTMVGTNNLAYTLDSAVTIASSSGTAGDFVQVNNVAVTAKDIGTQYNLPSGVRFSFNNYNKSDISAKNDSAFSGGTKSTLTVVAQKDIDGLSSNLISSLESKAKDDLTKQLDGNKQLLPFFTKETLTKKTYSKNAGDQASSVSLTGTVTYQGAALDKEQLTSFAQSILKDKITSDMTLSQNGIQTDVSNIKKNDDSITASVDLKAVLLPKINVVDSTKQISGKSFAEATTILKQLPQVADVTITNHPSLPFLPKILPRLSQNITIVIQSND